MKFLILILINLIYKQHGSIDSAISTKCAIVNKDCYNYTLFYYLCCSVVYTWGYQYITSPTSQYREMKETAVTGTITLAVTWQSFNLFSFVKDLFFS